MADVRGKLALYIFGVLIKYLEAIAAAAALE